MANKPDLRSVPYENGSYYRLKDKKLIVVVKNFGSAPAKATTTQVDFAGYGSCINPDNRAPQNQRIQPLDPGESVTLEFDCPSDNCFDPDCEFYITVDANNELVEDPTAVNKITRGVCRKPMSPDLVVVPDDTGSFVRREGGQLKIVVQNQGAAYARPSKTRVNLYGIDVDVPTPDLEPGYSAEVFVKAPPTPAKGKYSKGTPLKYTIALDIDDVVQVSNESNRLRRRNYEGFIPYHES